MATPIKPIVNISQYNYEIGDTVEVVTKQNALNAEFDVLSQDINETVSSINTDVDFITTARNELDANNIVHAPGSALPNEAGTAYAADVTTSPTDTTVGRVITTDAGPSQAYKRTNILGTVSQSGGVPTGAIIERGSNDDGDWVTYADGTTIAFFSSSVVMSSADSGFIGIDYPVTLVDQNNTGNVWPRLGGSVAQVASSYHRFNTTDLAYRFTVNQPVNESITITGHVIGKRAI